MAFKTDLAFGTFGFLPTEMKVEHFVKWKPRRQVLYIHTCDNFMMTMREICFLDEGDWGPNEGDFLKTCSSCFSYHFHMV